MVFDFNSDLAQEYGIYKNEAAYEIAEYVSSVNISAGFHAGDPLSIKQALEFAKMKTLQWVPISAILIFQASAIEIWI